MKSSILSTGVGCGGSLIFFIDATRCSQHNMIVTAGYVWSVGYIWSVHANVTYFLTSECPMLWLMNICIIVATKNVSQICSEVSIYVSGQNLVCTGHEAQILTCWNVIFLTCALVDSVILVPWHILFAVASVRVIHYHYCYNIVLITVQY